MAWDAGAMVGRVVLDKSGYTAPLRQVVAEARAAKPEIDRNLAQPFQPATNGLRQFLGELGKVQGVAAGLSILPGRMGSFAMAISGAVGLVGQLSTMLMASSGAAAVTTAAYVAAGTAGVASSAAVYRAVTSETVAIREKAVSTAVAATADRGAAVAAMAHAYANLQLASSIRAVQTARASGASSNAIMRMNVPVRGGRGGGGGGGDDVFDAEFTVRSVKALPGPASAAATSMRGLGTAAAGAGPALGIVAAAAAAVLTPLIGLGAITAALNSDFVRLAAQAESNAIAFEVMTGSAGEARQLMQELRDLGSKTPLNMPEITAAGKQLLAMGSSAKQVPEELRRLGDVGSLLNQPLQEMAYLYGQIRTQQTAYTADLNQFAGRGVPIYQELAKILGTNERGVKELASQGQITFPLIEQAFKSMTGEGGKFENGMLRASQGLQGMLSTMEDAWTTVKTTVGEALIEGMNLKGWVSTFTKGIEDNGDLIVGVFKAGVAQMQPFVDLFGSVLNWVQSGIGMWRELSAAFDAAFGNGASSSVASFVMSLNPLSLTLKAIGVVFDVIAWGLRQMASLIRTSREYAELLGAYLRSINFGPLERIVELIDRARAGIAAINAYWSGTVEKLDNPAAGGKAPSGGVRASVHDKPEGDSKPKSATPADADPKAKKAEEKAAKEAAESADRVRSLQIDSRITQLRAAGKEAEAAQLELWAKWEERYRKAVAAGNAAEAKQIEASYATEKAALAAQQQAEAQRAQAEAEQAAFDSRIDTRITQLKAAGKDSEAEQLALWQRFNKDMQAADGKEDQRQQLFARYWAESGAIKKREADATARTELEHQREMEQSRLRAAGRDEEAQRAQARYEREDAIARDSSAEARQLADERYAARIGEIDRAEAEKTAKERERLMDQLTQRARGDLGELDQVSAADRAAAYASQSRLVTYGPSVTSGIDRFFGPPTQSGGPGSSGGNGSPGGGGPGQDKTPTELAAIREEVKMMHTTTIRSIEENTKKSNITVVKF